MSAVIEMLNHAAPLLLAALLRTSWQGGLALALVWGFLKLCPRTAPRIQCWFWRLAYLKLLIAFVWGAPLTLAILPPPPSPLPPVMLPAQPLGTTPAFAESPPALQAAQMPAGSEQATVASHGILLTPLTGLAALWLALAAWQMVRAAAQWRMARRIARQCRLLQEPALLSNCAQFSQRLGLRRTPRLLTWTHASTPILLGTWKPAIVLPEGMSATSSPTHQQLMLAHELAHLRRRDLLWAWLPLLSRVLFSFHPLVWLAQRELTTAQEMDCDAIALRMTHAPIADYGDLLLRIATHKGHDAYSELTIVGMAASYHSLKRRLFAMKTIAPLSPGRLVLTGSALLTLGLVGIIPWRVAAQAQTAPAPTPAQEPKSMQPPVLTAEEITRLQQENTRSFPQPLKAHAGDYTIWLEKISRINTGTNTEEREITANGIRFKPNIGIYLKVIGRGSEINLLEGFAPHATAVDDKGAQAEPSPATVPDRLTSAAQGSAGALYMLLPNTGVKTLRSLEGELLVYDGNQKRMELAVSDLKPGYQKQFDTTTVKIESYRLSGSTIEMELTMTAPIPPIDPAVARDPKIVAEIRGQNSRSLRVELTDAQGHVANPMTMTSTSTPSPIPLPEKRPVPAGEPGFMRHSIHLTFLALGGTPPPKTLTLITTTRTGKTQRLPFKFTDIPLPRAK